MQLPKRWLIHTIKYNEYNGMDDWGADSYGEAQTIEHVRFDDTTVFSRDNTQNKIVANAVVYVDSVHSTPVVDYKERSKVTFNGKEYTLKKVVPCYYPRKNKMRHYELELV